MEEVLKEGKTMGNIRIIIDGCCSMRKSDVARNKVIQPNEGVK